MPNNLARTLILGTMPKGADPKTYIAAGPWCFSGLEDIYPDFATTFTMAKEPLADEKVLAKAVLAAKGLTAKLIPKMAKFLCPLSEDLPESYWHVLLIPWLGLISQQIIERWLRILALKESFAHTPLEIAIVDVENSTFAFANEEDLTLNGVLNVDFNHWIFSYLLSKTTLPNCWKLTTGACLNLGQKNLEPLKSKPQSLNCRQAILSLVKNLLRKLPVPHLKGLTLSQSLLFSLALNHESHQSDSSRLLQNQGQGAQELFALGLPDILPIVKSSLPSSIKNLKHPTHLTPNKKPQLRIANVEAYEDALYRQDLAIFRAKDNRLIFIQHGGNYGQIRYSCLTEMFEYTQQAFITWGWSKQENALGHFIPLPYPQLAKIRNRWDQQKASGLLFVGTEMPLFGYRLDSHPTPLQMVEYRQAKLKFLQNLDPKLQNQLLYRPYFDLPGCLTDYNFIHHHLPNIKRCVGDLKPYFLKTKLLIVDHHGTTLLEAMAANIPVIFYFNPKHWPLNQATQDFLDRFKALNIYHETAESAAYAINDLWPNLVSFWQSAKVQEVRQAFCQNFAQIIPNNENHIWVATLKKL